MLAAKRQEVEAPSLLPIGTYTWRVAGQYTEQENPEWTILNVPVQCVEAHEDVDEDELKEFGSVAAIRNRVSFFMTNDPEDKQGLEQAQFDVEQFIDACGVETDEDETLEEGLGRILGCTFAAPVTHKPDKKNPDRINTNLGKPVALA